MSIPTACAPKFLAAATTMRPSPQAEVVHHVGLLHVGEFQHGLDGLFVVGT